MEMVNDNVLGPVTTEEIRLLMFLSEEESYELERRIIERNSQLTA